MRAHIKTGERGHRKGFTEGEALMPKAQPLCTSAESDLGDRVLGEIEKNSFLALPGKGGHSRLLPSKTVRPNPGGFGEECYSSSSRSRLLVRIRVCAGLYAFNIISGGLLTLMSFSGSFNLASGGFLAVPPLFLHPLPSLISNYLNLPFGTQGRSWRLESVPCKQVTGHRKASMPRSPRGSCSVSTFVMRNEGWAGLACWVGLIPVEDMALCAEVLSGGRAVCGGLAYVKDGLADHRDGGVCERERDSQLGSDHPRLGILGSWLSSLP